MFSFFQILNPTLVRTLFVLIVKSANFVLLNQRIEEMETETLIEEKVVEKLVDERNLIVFNDDFNTLDHVIESLIKVCKHYPIQAEQCTHIIHFKGKCDVKSGHYEALEVMCTGLLDRGISAEIH